MPDTATGGPGSDDGAMPLVLLGLLGLLLLFGAAGYAIIRRQGFFRV
jgi:hypothetical protein